MFKRLLIACALVLSFGSVKAAEPIITNYPPAAVKTTETQTGDRKLVLPQDENKLYLTLYGDPSDEKYQTIRKWFNENDELKAIRTQTHYSAIDSDSNLFKDRYADEVPKEDLPCIRFVTPGGVELLRIDGTKIPMSDKSLSKGIKTNLLQNLFGRKHDNEKQDERLDQKIKDTIDSKIDNDLPPVAQVLFAPLVRIAVYSAFGLVILIGAVVAVVGAIRQSS